MAYRETARIRERKDQTRQCLVDAATRLVASNGFGGVQVSMIAAEAGMATGTVYGYFPSKTALFRAVFEEASQRELDAFAAAPQPGASPDVQLQAMVSTFAGRALANPGLARALIAEPAEADLDEARQRFRKAYAEQFETVLSTGIDQGLFAPQDAWVSAQALVGGVAEALVGSAMGECPADADWRRTRVEAVTAFAMRAVADC
ncbi:AcrR family transcriptional regulator [Natronocella acetinitrilica]|uniref:AcrR family transcriptional regulator n=1 Tax=Natronocella acetinitrilica TaxID=414046 RepID=A0AAE3G5B6_9GAMM|nr:TetR/AcrR family transcriptional regulator [Natronocella acetinitrilica]MCP1675924.1 AcrR family transcriptional regulator [Natronocella acetinitrilica]